LKIKNAAVHRQTAELPAHTKTTLAPNLTPMSLARGAKHFTYTQSNLNLVSLLTTISSNVSRVTVNQNTE